MKLSSLKRWCLLALLLILQPWVHAEYVPDAGYEAAKRSSTPNPTCPTNYDLPGSWGFPTCECTSYAAYRLNLNNVQHNGVPFANDWTSSVHFGYAHHWNSAAGDLGIREDNYPAVGSVAYWGTEKVAGTGHVAYVQHLFTHPYDGRLTGIGVMEYNWADCKGCNPDHKYRYRRIGTGRKWPTSFLHFEEKGTDADKTNATCVTVPKRPGSAHAGTFCWKHNGSNAACGSASSYHFYDYRSCQRYAVTSATSPSATEYCAQADTGAYPGYTARIVLTDFPTSIAPSANGADFASCPSGGTGTGNSREVSGRNLAQRAKLWRSLDSALN